MSELKFADVTLVNGRVAWINFSEIESITDCLYRFCKETNEVIEDYDDWGLKATKLTMKSGRIYYVDFMLSEFDDKFNLNKYRLPA